MPKYRKKRKRESRRQEPGVKTNGDSSNGHIAGKRGSGYADIVKANPLFEKFYKTLGIVPDEEWDIFMDCLKKSLPATFRITGYKSHASALLAIIKSQYFSDLMNSSDDCDANEKNESQYKPTCLSWYPNGLGWQLNLSRIVIRKSESLAKLHSFLVAETESGNISRQEAVSMIPPLLLNVKSHHKVLDMCAAPGSKTAQLIEMLHANDDKIPEGIVVANDMDNKRCYMLVHQTKRLKSPCFLITNHDASVLPNLKIKNKDDEVVNMEFDRVLCDVPCCGDGTIRKNYEIWRKWNVGNANNLHHIQLRILKRGLEMLASGGRLVYSTCSLNPVENEAVIAATMKLCQGSIELLDVCEELPGLKTNPGLQTWKVMNKKLEEINCLEEISEEYQTQIKASMFPPSKEEAQALHIDRCRRILPHHQDTGCFFVAVLQKNGVLPWQKVSTKSDPEGHEDELSESVIFSNKRRKTMGYKEDPFFFFKENDPVWTELRDFYKMQDFPDTQLLTRCQTGKKRNIYFVSNAVKNILNNNEGRLKIINCGLKLFCRSDNKGTACGFRTTQEGISTIMPFVNSRIVEITKEDIAHLLTKEYPPIEKMSSETRQRADKFETGSVILVLNITDLYGNNLRLELCGWKGKSSLRCYVPRGERLHYLRLCNIDISKYEINPNKKFKIKLSNEDEENSEENTMDICEDDGSNVKDNANIEEHTKVEHITSVKDDTDTEVNTDLKDSTVKDDTNLEEHVKCTQ